MFGVFGSALACRSAPAMPSKPLAHAIQSGVRPS